MNRSIEKPKILIVDDVPGNIRLLAEMLSHDFEIYAATSGPLALKIARSKPLDMILTDIVMPGMDGAEVCKVLKSGEDTKDIPIVFVTGSHGTEVLSNVLALGAVDCIIKPVDKFVLRATINKHLRNKVDVYND